jgi:hypothetical protein
MKVRWTLADIAGPIAQEYDDKHYASEKRAFTRS